MPEVSANLSLPYLMPSQAQKHVTHNEALALLDAVVQLAVVSRDLTVPPASPDTGARYIAGDGATGAWAGRDGFLAVAQEGGGWLFVAPQAGWQARDLGAGEDLLWDGSAWQVRSPDLEGLEGVGINTVPDATNRLSVAAPATLLSHEGAGHQLKVNKAATGDTASLLFQTGWSGRAEMGLAGNDAFSLKTSADGSTWTEALSVSSAGIVSGQAVQADAQDTAAGKLARAEFTYGPATLLGTVTETAGQPTGAVIERGQTADGSYVRFADGTQICWADLEAGSIVAEGSGTLADPYRTAEMDWSFPLPFVGIGADVSVQLTARMNINAPAKRAVTVSYYYNGISQVNQISASRTSSITTADLCYIRALAVGRWF